MSTAFDQKRKSTDHFKTLFENIQHNPKDPKSGEIWLDIEIIDAVNGYFEEKDTNHIIGRHEKLEHCWTKLSLKDIILKNKNDFAP